MMNLSQNLQIELRQAQTDGSPLSLRSGAQERPARQPASRQEKPGETQRLRTFRSRTCRITIRTCARNIDLLERKEKFIELMIKEGHPPSDSTSGNATSDLEKSKDACEERTANGAGGDRCKNSRRNRKPIST